MKADIRGSVALVTGASRGIGRAVAVALAREGCDLALVARGAEGLEETAESCRAEGARCLTIAVDLANTAAIPAVVERCVEALGRIDILVNNAGIYGRRGPSQEADPAMWDAVVDLNLRTAMHLTRAALPHIIEAPRGAVIHIASVAGKMAFGGGAAYTASKHGLVGFAGALYEDVREHGVKVCAICPGFVNTPMVASRGLDAARMIQPEDVADTVSFVATFPDTGCPTEILLRPQRTPYVSR